MRETAAGGTLWLITVRQKSKQKFCCWANERGRIVNHDWFTFWRVWFPNYFLPQVNFLATLHLDSIIWSITLPRGYPCLNKGFFLFFYLNLLWRVFMTNFLQVWRQIKLQLRIKSDIVLQKEFEQEFLYSSWTIELTGNTPQAKIKIFAVWLPMEFDGVSEGWRAC